MITPFLVFIRGDNCFAHWEVYIAKTFTKLHCDYETRSGLTICLKVELIGTSILMGLFLEVLLTCLFFRIFTMKLRNFRSCFLLPHTRGCAYTLR